MARPTKYTEAIAEQICELIATTSKGLNAICASGSFPNVRTVYRWLSDNKEFCQRYARAREMQCDLLAEQILDISDDETADIIVGAESSYPNSVKVQRAKLRADSRKWLMAKLHPKKYGDKMEMSVTEIPAPVIELSNDDEDQAE